MTEERRNGRAPRLAPKNIDLTTPSAARVYDYFLGGAHNFAPDREMARRILKLHPTAEANAQANRAFLHRAVRYLVGQGVRQFVDLVRASRRSATCTRWPSARPRTRRWSTSTSTRSPWPTAS